MVWGCGVGGSWRGVGVVGIGSVVEGGGTDGGDVGAMGSAP